MVSPPKPWERGAVAAAPVPPPSTTSSVTAVGPSAPAPESPQNDSVPTRPPALSSAPPVASSANPYSTSAPASSYAAGYSPYSSYSRFGSPYSPYGTTYGGGIYGGMGYGMNTMGYGMNSMYGGYGMPGMPMDPNNPSLSQQLESTTQHTFALLHSIVQTFTGMAQMLESTFMATHSSFFAMVGVVDQFTQLRNALGSVLGLFGLVRWLKELLTGRRRSSGMQDEFRAFINGKPVQGPQGPPAPKPSKKPLIIFLLAIFGIPYAMHKLVKILAQRAPRPNTLVGPAGAPLGPSSLAFARAKYDFVAANSVELSLKENEIVAIVGKLDPATGMEVDPRTEVVTDWWRGRTRDGREGWFPSKRVEVLERKKQDAVPVKSVE